MKEMLDRPTGENLKRVIVETLAEFGILIENVYMFSVDNGANVVKSVRIIRNELECIKDSDEDNSSDDDDNNEDSASESEADDDDDGDNNSEKVVVLLKKLRTSKMRLQLQAENMRKPIKDSKVRWNSQHNMLFRLVELKPFCLKYQNVTPELRLTESLWGDIDKLLEALKPVKTLTRQVQSVQMTLSDFYVYLDPRYQVLLSPEDRKAAQKHLLFLYKKIYHIEDDSLLDAQPSSVVTDSTDTVETHETEFKMFLTQMESRTNTRQSQDSHFTVIKIARKCATYVRKKLRFTCGDSLKSEVIALSSSYKVVNLSIYYVIWRFPVGLLLTGAGIESPKNNLREKDSVSGPRDP
ncbi:hypothetical protein Bhyg_12137, partial [Pseudolycoriella hygida]